MVARVGCVCLEEQNLEEGEVITVEEKSADAQHEADDEVDEVDEAGDAAE